MNTGAPLGFCCMGHRGAHFAATLRDAGKFSLIRFVGTTPSAFAAPKTETAQRAEVGYCASGARSTHVALPPVYALSAFDGLKSRGMALWGAMEQCLV